MPEEIRKKLGMLCWIIIVVVFVVGVILGYVLARPSDGQLGDCLRSDTVTVFATDVTQQSCVADCGPQCLWVVH